MTVFVIGYQFEVEKFSARLLVHSEPNNLGLPLAPPPHHLLSRCSRFLLCMEPGGSGSTSRRLLLVHGRKGWILRGAVSSVRPRRLLLKVSVSCFLYTFNFFLLQFFLGNCDFSSSFYLEFLNLYIRIFSSLYLDIIMKYCIGLDELLHLR